MRILKMKVKGLKFFEDDLEIDFLTKQPLRNVNAGILYEIAPRIYQNNALALIGVNASGKTMTLKVISFAIQLLNNESINNIKGNEILKGLKGTEEIVFETYFCTHLKTIYKLETRIRKEAGENESEGRYYIFAEEIWHKEIKSVKTRKSIYESESFKLNLVRENEEEYLPKDVSIVIALNKRNDSQIYCKDLIDWTNINIMRMIGRGKIQEELITFLDPSIEYLRVDEFDEKKLDIRLKFKKADEIQIHSPRELASYLSSGTMKGINIFLNAMLVLRKGGYLIIDELENHFNKEIAATLVGFFTNHKVNRKGATLLFSTHYPELLDQFERNDSIFIIRNAKGIRADNLSDLLKRNDKKKSEVYQSGYLQGTTPVYETYMELKKAIIQYCDEVQE
jgi:hypothetical protein